MFIQIEEDGATRFINTNLIASIYAEKYSGKDEYSIVNVYLVGGDNKSLTGKTADQFMAKFLSRNEGAIE